MVYCQGGFFDAKSKTCEQKNIDNRKRTKYNGIIVRRVDMITVKSMEVRDNFKEWCVKVNDGEIIRISRPKDQYIYMIGENTYSKMSLENRMVGYVRAFAGGGKIDNLRRLDEIASLIDDWNGNGATAFSEDLLKRVRKIIVSVRSQPEIFPTANESIQLEWDREDGEYLEMEVTLSGIDVFMIDKDGNERTWSVDGNLMEVQDIVKEFFER